MPITWATTSKYNFWLQPSCAEVWRKCSFTCRQKTKKAQLLSLFAEIKNNLFLDSSHTQLRDWRDTHLTFCHTKSDGTDWWHWGLHVSIYFGRIQDLRDTDKLHIVRQTDPDCYWVKSVMATFSQPIFCSWNSNHDFTDCEVLEFTQTAHII